MKRISLIILAVAAVLVGIGLAQVSAKIFLEAILLPVTAAVTKAVKKDDDRRRICI